MRRVFGLLLVAGTLCAQQRQTEESLQAELANAIQQKNGPHALMAMIDLDGLYGRERKWTQQAAILKNIVGYWSRAIEANSIGVARYTADLAEAQERAEDFIEAEGNARSAIAIFEKHGEKYAAADVRTKRILVAILQREGRTAEADALKANLPAEPPHQHWDKHPEILSKREPEYTSAASQKRINGNISLSVVIDEDGKPQDVEVIAPLGFGLDENAVKTVKKWKFAPAISNGHAVAASATVEVSFRLL